MPKEDPFQRLRSSLGITRWAFLKAAKLILFAGLCGLIAEAVLAESAGAAQKACTNMAKAAFKACRSEVSDDYWIARGNCFNVSDAEDRKECVKDAKVERREAKEECRDQLDARKDICEALGEEPYNPQIDPANFVDPTAIGDGVAPNPYFPLVPGSGWTYNTKDQDGNLIETITVEVLEGETKEILGVTCAVVRDVVKDADGETMEDTRDWYAQAINGDVWYLGEIAQNFEDGELVDIEGSWKSGVNGAWPGIVMKAAPQVGDVYRQEFLLGEAEDMGEVLSIDEASAVAPAAACVGDCVQTKDFTPLEPDAVEHKYYKSGVGTILEEDLEGGERVELVDFHIGPAP